MGEKQGKIRPAYKKCGMCFLVFEDHKSENPAKAMEKWERQGVWRDRGIKGWKDGRRDNEIVRG